MNSGLKNIALVLLVLLGFLLFYQIISERSSKDKEIPYSKFLQLIEQKRIISNPDSEKLLVIKGNVIQGHYNDPAVSGKETPFTTYVAYTDNELISLLRKNRIQFKGVPQEESLFWRSIIHILPWVIIIGFFWMMLMRQLQSTGNRALSFGRSRAKLTSDDKKKITFNDVAGVEEAKEELKEVVAYLKDAKKFESIGARIPRGVLLVGHPGTGKTLLARGLRGRS